jgi:hypothetical protein
MFYYTPCRLEDGTIFRERIYTWTPPQICNDATGVALPPTTRVDCSMWLMACVSAIVCMVG